MRVIGTVEPEKSHQLAEISQDGEYLGGSVVLLSPYEMKAIKMLQDACKGLKDDYHLMEWGKPENAMIDDLFMLVYRFAETKFAINDFKDKIERLENVLGEVKNEL